MTKEEELSKYMAQIEYFKQQMTSLESQSQYIQAAINEYNRAKITLENLEKAENNSELILPIGGSTYINATAKDTSNVLFDIGSGLVTEKKAEDAIKGIDKRLKDLEKNQEQVNSMMEQLQTDATKISMEAQKLYQEMQQG